MRYSRDERRMRARKACRKAVKLVASGMYDQSIRYYDKAAKLEPKNHFILLSRGVILTSIGRPADAVRDFKRVLELDPSNPEAYHHMGVALNAMGMPDEADKMSRLAVNGAPQDARLCYKMAADHFDQGKYAMALELYDRVLKIDPRHVDAHAHRAVILCSSGRSKDALESCNAALEIDPELVDVHIAKYISLFSLGMKKEAGECYDTVARMLGKDSIELELMRDLDSARNLHPNYRPRSGQKSP